MNALSDVATTPNIHTVIRTLAVALLALALVALFPGRLLFRPWHGPPPHELAIGSDAELHEALRELPTMMRALQLLKDDYRRHHFVTFNPDFEVFLRDVKTALDAHQLPVRVFDIVFGDTNLTPHPDCKGTWMEFGVHTGGTITWAANWRTKYCTSSSPPVFGFDTFTGLPEEWWGGWKPGSFDLKGELPPVPDNVRLVKGLFNESLPVFLRDQDAAARGGRLANCTYVHIDCDLYGGANDALTLLSDRISPGAILLFDELVNYPDWRHHEVLALWQWLGRSGRQLEVIGMFGPLAGRADAVELYPAGDLGGFKQSAAFIVL